MPKPHLQAPSQLVQRLHSAAAPVPAAPAPAAPVGLEGAVLRHNFFDAVAELPEHLRQLLPPPEVRLDGSLVVWGFAARGACVYMYGDAEGTRTVYRPATVAFDSRSLESYRSVPVTNDHPPTFVSPENNAQYAQGAVLEAARAYVEHGLIAVGMVLHTAEIIAAYHQGRRCLSTGEWCLEREEQGVFEGVPYTHVLELVAINHLALVDVGRAGPLAQIRTHSARPRAAAPVNHSAPSGAGGSMEHVKITVYGIEVWVHAGQEEAARARIEREMAARTNSALTAREAELVAAHQAETERLQGELDAQAARINELVAAPTEEQLQERINSAAGAVIEQRVANVARYAPLFGGQASIKRSNAAGQEETVSLVQLSHEELLREGILKARPNAAEQIKGKGLGYLEAYAASLLDHAATSDASTTLLDEASSQARTNATDAGSSPSRLEAARKKQREAIEAASRR